MFDAVSRMASIETGIGREFFFKQIVGSRETIARSRERLRQLRPR
jgi:hypothetical protein